MKRKNENQSLKANSSKKWKTVEIDVNALLRANDPNLEGLLSLEEFDGDWDEAPLELHDADVADLTQDNSAIKQLEKKKKKKKKKSKAPTVEEEGEPKISPAVDETQPAFINAAVTTIDASSIRIEQDGKDRKKSLKKDIKILAVSSLKADKHKKNSTNEIQTATPLPTSNWDVYQLHQSILQGIHFLG